MTTEDITQRNLAKLDAAYSAMRAIVADPKHLNIESAEMYSARVSETLAIKECFAAKNVIHNATT